MSAVDPNIQGVAVDHQINSLRSEYSGKRSLNFAIAVVISLAWAITMVGAIILGQQGLIVFDEKVFTLNLLGDFVAGGGSILAIVWFVFSYRQQSLEISQNTEALILQLREVSESVKQQKEQATQQGRQARSIEISEAHTRRDILFRACDFYVAQIASSAAQLMDIATGYKRETIRSFWSEFGNGNKDVFFDVLVRSEDALKIFITRQQGWVPEDAAERAKIAAEKCVELAIAFVDLASEIDERSSLIDSYLYGPLGDFVSMVAEILHGNADWHPRYNVGNAEG